MAQNKSLALTAAIVFLSFSIFCCKQTSKVNPIAPKLPAEQNEAETPPGQSHEMTAVDVEAFLDGLVPLQLERSDIAGATIAVVKDGKLLFEKGYGFSDLAERKRVSATDSLFRPGSISKLFTWTAVMQQVEQGKLDLDRDVNTYLDFQIPATYPQPITLRHIMTHTAGFGETIKDLFIPDTKDLASLRDYLANHIPNRIFPPGTTPAYSNYATTLAGYMVQRVSGKPFNDYIDENIFRPLNMRRTTFVQPLPKDLKPLMSNGYRLASLPAGEFEVVQAWPAGSVSTCADDMTHFMIAHLQNGEYNGARILKAETARLMHSRQFAAHPEMNGMALGFYEETRNGHRIIGHGGDTVYFHSDLHLVLDAGVGFFVSYNSAGNGQGSERGSLWDKFLDRYFPYTPPNTAPLSIAKQDAQMVSGAYLSSRRSQGNLMEALFVIGESKVFSNPDGTISVDDIKDLAKQPKKFREISPLVYRELYDQDRLAFKRDANGRLFFAMDWPFMTFQRVGLLQSKIFNYVLLGFSLTIILLTLIVWPVAALLRRHYGYRLNLTPSEKRLRLAVRLVCAIDVIFILALVIFFSTLESPGALNSHIDPWMHLIQIAGWIGAIGTILVGYNAIRSWRSVPSLTTAAAQPVPGSASEIASRSFAPNASRKATWVKIFQTLIALACIGLTWFLIYWNTLNLTSNY